MFHFLFYRPTPNLCVPVVFWDSRLLVNLTPSPSLHFNLQTKLSFVYCTYSILLRQTSQDMFIFSIGQSGFSRPSIPFGSNGEWKHIISDMPWCPSLGSIMSLYLCGEHNTIAIHVYCSDYEYCMFTTLIAATASYILYAWGPYQIVYV